MIQKKENRYSNAIKILTGWILLLVFWWILADFSIYIVVLMVGVFGAGLVLALYHRFGLSIEIPVKSLASPFQWIKFIASLIIQIIITIAVTCYVILTGKAKPKIVAYKTELETGYGLLFLLNSITLTPTTIAILSEEKLIYICHLYLKDQRDYEQMVEIIRNKFEKPLKNLIG